MEFLNRLRRYFKLTARALVRIVSLIFCVWAAGGIIYFVPEVPLLCRFGGMIYLIATTRWFVRNRKLRDWSRWALVSFAAVWVAGLTKQPSNDRLWAEDQAIQSEVEHQDGSIVIRNFRHCRYSTDSDFTMRRSDFRFRLADLRRVWFVVHRFTGLQGIAHNFLSFSVDTEQGTRYFCVSVEVRREREEAFSPFRGMYRGFELIYVFADELDEIGQRLQVRPNDRVYLFPVNASEDQVQRLFLDIAARANRLRSQPEFYHSLLNNCTNNIVLHTRPMTDELTWLDPRVVAPGFADRYAKAMKLIGTNAESFASVQNRCLLDPVTTPKTSQEFSKAIRAAFAADGLTIPAINSK